MDVPVLDGCFQVHPTENSIIRPFLSHPTEIPVGCVLIRRNPTVFDCKTELLTQKNCRFEEELLKTYSYLCGAVNRSDDILV